MPDQVLDIRFKFGPEVALSEPQQIQGGEVPGARASGDLPSRMERIDGKSAAKIGRAHV